MQAWFFMMWSVWYTGTWWNADLLFTVTWKLHKQLHAAYFINLSFWFVAISIKSGNFLCSSNLSKKENSKKTPNFNSLCAKWSSLQVYQLFFISTRLGWRGVSELPFSNLSWRSGIFFGIGLMVHVLKI